MTVQNGVKIQIVVSAKDDQVKLVLWLIEKKTRI